ncbi:MAG: hypothetical protein ACLP7J_22345, partial [Streptosporangiaceae bacterium]
MHQTTRRIALAVAAAGALLGLSLPAAQASTHPAATHPAATHPAAARPNIDYRRACPVAARHGRAACMVLIRTNVAQRKGRPDQAPSGYGYGPSSLQSAYNLPSSTAGSGETVAVVDAYNDPNAASDLAAYRSAW